MQFGLIGGIGPAATDFYYRRLISTFAQRKFPLDMTIVHADTPTLLDNLARKDAARQARIFAALTERLDKAGAEFVAVTSIAGHFCRKEFEALSPLPVVDLISSVDRALVPRGLRRIGILGTRTVMETRFYGGITTAAVLAPDQPEMDEVHGAYIALAASGVVTEAQRKIFHAAGHRLMAEQGAEAIMLGGTDLALVFNEQSAPFPLVDCATLHVDAIAEKAIASMG